MNDDAPLAEVLGGRYRIERELGRGGMGRVYLAHDLKHSRNVALKVIRADVAASLGRERFLREIGIAARLRHPNIVPLYDSGDADGVLYFVMPYEEGQSLRERLSQGPIPIGESVSVLRDVARALGYAHERGIVHRDVKPDNVMLSGGAAVVTDFGIAKAVSIAQENTSPSTLTRGGGIGTPAYMAPEQAVGDPSTDHRADIYSFGCLAFELFTGKPPFHDLPPHQIIAAHVATVPPLVTELRGDMPVSVAELIARCLEKSPAARPESARDLLAALDGVGTTDASNSSSRGTGRRRGRAFQWGAAALVALVATAAYLTSRNVRASGAITLAVLPFDNVASDTAVDFVAGELADEVAAVLTRVPGIEIKSRSGARAYRNQRAVDLAQAGSKLKADYLVTGSVRQDHGRWILSADLSRAADAALLWGESFNLTVDQQTGAAESIAENVVTALRKRFPRAVGAAVALASNEKTLNNEAYRLYLRGQVKLDRRGQSVKESADLFRAAIHEDARFARAYSGLSMALSLFPYFHQVPAREVHDDLVSAARKAIELDSTLAQPHIALALDHWFNYEWRNAETELKTAIRLDARDIEARTQYARQLIFEGRLLEATQQLRIARAQDPSSALVLSYMSYVFLLNHQLDSALAESRRALENDPGNINTAGFGAMIQLEANLLKEARELARLAPDAFPSKYYVIARSGDPATARKYLQDLDTVKSPDRMAQTRRAITYFGLGDTAKGLTALERATNDREVWQATFGAVSPIYDDVRASARFQALLRRVGLAP